MRVIGLVAVAWLLVAAVGVPVALPLGTKATDTREGKGAVAEPGQTVSVHYTGWIWAGGMKGPQFDSSRGKAPFVFTLGTGDVIAGWDEGVAGMRVGGKRTLLVPASAAYGERGAGGVVPPGATLLFEVELLGVQ